MMNPFLYRGKRLYCETVALEDIAGKVGTPAYVYSKNGIADNFIKIDNAFKGIQHRICYAFKANSEPHILRLLADLGAGADVVSGGELLLALENGFLPKKIVFAGVGKTDPEIELAIEKDILAINVESGQELKVVAEIAARMNKVAPIAIRINPDIDIEGHPYLTTGKQANKFGIGLKEAIAGFQWAAQQKSLRIVGVHNHLGSMITKSLPYKKSAETLANLVLDLKHQGIHLEHIDLGGGIGVDYHRVLADDGDPFTVDPGVIAGQTLPVFKKTGCEILMEPGRAIVGPNGALLSNVLYRKVTKGKTFIIVDAAMNDLLRPSLYGAYHAILPVSKSGKGVEEIVDVVGPVCESGDFLAQNRELMPLDRGDLVAVMTAGAYGYTLASNYNTRPRPVEVWVDGEHFEVIRERETLF